MMANFMHRMRNNMSKPKHTPRPWSWSAIDNFIMGKGGNGANVVVAEISKGSCELPNKRLIVAAPDLLSVIKNTLTNFERLEDLSPDDIGVIEMIKQELEYYVKKIEGE